MSEQLKQIESQISQGKIVYDNLNNNNFTIYFFTLDTKGNPTAGIANIYEHVKILNKLGYNAAILHEKNDYKRFGDENGYGIADWLGNEYANLPHVSIEAQILNISPADFIVIPEIFSNIMDQVKTFPCKKIVLAQSYDYIMELLPIGKRWNIDYGFNDVITTSEKQANYIKSLFPSINTHVVPISIPDYFKPNKTPKIPVISILTRNHGDAAKIAKTFYLQYPMYKWVTFKELRGLPREQFASELSKSCLAVWVDDQSGFGTFPIEAIECETPVIGKIPNMVPEWMEKINDEGNLEISDNGIWTNTMMNIPELIATYLKIWFEDSVPSELLLAMKNTTNKYTTSKQETELVSVYNTLITTRTLEIEQMLEKLEAQYNELV